MRRQLGENRRATRQHPHYQVEMRKLLLLSLIAVAVIAIVCGLDSRPSMARPNIAEPQDDQQLIVARFGLPDKDDSTDYDAPRPPIPTRFMTYQKEHVRFIFVPDKFRQPAPSRWK